ncbi:MAG: hypothetical protein RL736_622 [Pseudomonadota bacterium]|jgi:hypothetical protein
MIILTKWEEKCLQILTFIVSIVDVANETLYRVKHKKYYRISK